MNDKWIKLVFIAAGIYDGVLAFSFLLMPEAIFNHYQVEPPNHFGYVEFPAMLLLIFAVMFFRVAVNPVKCRELMLYGAALKFSYAFVVFRYAMTTGVPFMWIPWAWVDSAFLVLFLMSWYRTGRHLRVT
ncbi:MAG: hypothetical protein OEY45_08710 [Gammaproteobacteria bacterium]|nr:hypothetical protein [Gammaproteobacteria bacterium]